MSEIKGQLRFMETMAATAHKALSTFVEAVIFYHSIQESTSGKFVGSKERVRNYWPEYVPFIAFRLPQGKGLSIPD